MRFKPVGAFLIAASVTACSAKPQVARVEGAARGTPVELRFALAKSATSESPVAKTPAWEPDHPTFVYPLPFDYGIRKDSEGTGYFLAARSHGKHNGVDMLAPVGTPLTAICSGKAKSAMRGGFGRTVQLVCKLPDELGGDEGLYVSFFFAHLSRTPIRSTFEDVEAGAAIGFVGKTGNAAGPNVSPHLHLEAIVRGTLEEAMAERHAGLEPKAKRAVDRFFDRLDIACLSPSHLTSQNEIRRERRVDPFVLLTCAAKPKPAFSAPPEAGLRDASVKWSSHYASNLFDVDRGPIDTTD